jgi:hypothetical protein
MKKNQLNPNVYLKVATYYSEGILHHRDLWDRQEVLFEKATPEHDWADYISFFDSLYEGWWSDCDIDDSLLTLMFLFCHDIVETEKLYDSNFGYLPDVVVEQIESLVNDNHWVA